MAASAALLLGVSYAAVSAYWGLGGTALLDTVGGAFERAGRVGSAGLIALVWVTVVLKLLAAVLGLIAVADYRCLDIRQRRLARRAGWAAALILVMYGGVLSVTGWLVQVGIVPAAANADHEALRWHAYLWDPWFLVWGLLMATGLALSRQSRPNHQLSTLRH
jgi:Protein of unknown function (DUF3995)